MSIISTGIIVGSGGGGGGGGGGIAEAPLDGKLYGRQNGAWAAAATARHRHLQNTPAAVWQVQHNLNQKPVAIWTFDSAGEQIFGEPDYAGATLQYIEIHFCVAVSGMAFAATLL
jgi:hypothetical protein